MQSSVLHQRWCLTNKDQRKSIQFSDIYVQNCWFILLNCFYQEGLGQHKAGIDFYNVDNKYGGVNTEAHHVLSMTDQSFNKKYDGCIKVLRVGMIGQGLCLISVSKAKLGQKPDFPDFS